MNIWKQKLAIIFLSLSILSAPMLAQARGLVPCGGYLDDAGTQREDPCDLRYVFILIATATNWLISTAGIYAVYQIVNGGFWLVVTMGDEESITKHKKTITNAVVGFVFTMMAFILVNTALNGILLGLADTSETNKDPIRIDFTQPLCYLNPGGEPGGKPCIIK